MPSGKKRKRHKMATHKRKKRLRKNRHKKRKQFVDIWSKELLRGWPTTVTLLSFLMRDGEGSDY